jgi:hypothetical protein
MPEMRMQAQQQMQVQAQQLGKSSQQLVVAVAAARAVAGCMHCGTPGNTEEMPVVAVGVLAVQQQLLLRWTVMLTQR